jgi:Fe2+ transport system protein FeoA
MTDYFVNYLVRKVHRLILIKAESEEELKNKLSSMGIKNASVFTIGDS